MANQLLKLKDIEEIFRVETCKILGLDPDAEINGGRVRKTWPKNGQPAWGLNENVIFLRTNTLDDSIIKQYDVQYSPINADTANRQLKYTRVHDIHYLLYGPDSFDDADTIRAGLYTPDIKIDFAKKNLFLILDLDAPVRLPELYGGKWYQRVDFHIRFNEAVIRESTTPYLKTVNVSINTEKGEI